MISATLNEIKKEIQQLDASTLQSLCLRMGKYKKENKELLAYLLFEAHDEPGYIRQVKNEMDDLFSSIPPDRNLYIVKKMIRKILRVTNKHIRYSGLPQTELEIRIHFCQKVKSSTPLIPGTVMFNLYQQQLKKISSILNKLPEDFQADYSNALADIK